MLGSARLNVKRTVLHYLLHDHTTSQTTTQPPLVRGDNDITISGSKTTDYMDDIQRRFNVVDTDDAIATTTGGCRSVAAAAAGAGGGAAAVSNKAPPPPPPHHHKNRKQRINGSMLQFVRAFFVLVLTHPTLLNGEDLMTCMDGRYRTLLSVPFGRFLPRRRTRAITPPDNVDVERRRIVVIGVVRV